MDMIVCCAECGSMLDRTPEGWDGGSWPDSDGHWRPGTDCISGNGPGDQHVPDLDLPDSLDPEEVEAWLDR